MTKGELVKGHGVSNPDVIFIIDHPQGEDLRNGYSLTGAAEYKLKGLLKDNGLYLDQYYRTSLIKTEPAITLDKASREFKGQGLKKYREANQDLIKAHAQILIDEINILKPNLLIPLSELSFNFLTGLEGIRKFRGSILQTSLVTGEVHKLWKQTKVLPVLGPYPYLNQDYKLRIVTSLDLSRIHRYSNDSAPPETQIRPWVCKNAGEFRNFVDRSYKPDGFVTFDIESFLQIPTCISFCFDGIEACCVPLLDKSIDRDNRALLWMLVSRLLSSEIAKGNQNIKYDDEKLSRWFFNVNNITDDCMLAAACIYPEFEKNLGFLTSIYTELPYFKDEGRDFDPTIHKREQYYLYNAKDSIAAWQIIQKQKTELLELGTEFVYRNTMKCYPIYKRSEERGIRIDEAEREKLTAKYTNLFEIEVIKLRQLTGKSDINPLSSPQMNKLVFNELGYIAGRYQGANVKGTDEESLECLMMFAEHRSYVSRDILRVILNCRKFHKVIEILELPLHPDKRFRHEANLAGTETGRTSGGRCTDQLLIIPEKGKIRIKNLGHSLQTIGKHGFAIDGTTYGKDIRDMFVPSRGYSFVEIDLSGAEARVDRVLSGNYDMEIFSNPGIHKYTGGLLYDCDPSEIKKNTLVESSPGSGKYVDRYHEAKTTRHAGERNMGPARLVMMIQRPLDECTMMLNKFHEKESAIRSVYHRDIINAINETNCLIMPNGRRRDFFDRIGPSVYNEGFSEYPQAIVSDQTKFCGIAPTFVELEWAEMLVEAHDGVLAEVPLGRELEYASVYVKNIEVPIDFRFGSIKRDYELVIPAEVGIGQSWGGIKEVKGFRP